MVTTLCYGWPWRWPRKKKKEEGGFDFNILIQGFWTFLIIYSFGSVIIGISQGRIQDRTGGDFTAYDFFDNIFAFKEWSWETTLGFDPIEALESFTKKGALDARVGGCLLVCYGRARAHRA